VTICSLYKEKWWGRKEEAAMPESVGKIADVSGVSGSGTGPAKKRASDSRHYHHEEDHDTVTISAEARKRFLMEEEDGLPAEEE
jgi:hypothetical protein